MKKKINTTLNPQSIQLESAAQQTLSKSLLIGSGKALYGERWQTELARDLGLSDGRRIRQWLCDERPIPDKVWNDLCKLLKSREIQIQCMLDVLKESVIKHV